MLAALADEREPMALVVAMTGDEAVGSARVDFGPGATFAGLFSAVTVPAWRGRGIYRALVAYRAGLAAARGYRYLRVETSLMSRPILRRLGFEPVATTTPYLWSPPDPMGEPPRG
jgi:GNAT superfamily N-acetyltransferase